MNILLLYQRVCVFGKKRAFPRQQIDTPDPFWFVKSNRHGFEERGGRLTAADLAKLHRTHLLLSYS